MSRVVNPVEVNGKWYHFGLPECEVFVIYEDGVELSVAFQDEFTTKDAYEYADMWSGGKYGKVVAVEHRDHLGLLRRVEV